MDIEFQKVYKARVESVRQECVSVTGIRCYEIFFRNGKKMYYERSSKQTMLITPGVTIRFTAEKLEGFDVWVIKDVLDLYTPEQIAELNFYHEEKKHICT